MNYARIYELLIEKRRIERITRSDCYCERHHFIPRCMGGGNEAWNLVYLTAKEHFVAHHLLWKSNPSNIKLLNAFVAMCTKQERQKERKLYVSAKRYEALKNAYAESRRRMFADMPEEQRLLRRANIKAGCAKRTPEQKAAIKAKREAYFASLTEAEKAEISLKRQATISARSEARKNEIFENISRAHRKMSEADELRVVAEYENGKTALEISRQPWCSLGREGVNYLLRRRGVATHQARRWEALEDQICEDFKSGKFPTRDALAKAYDASWSAISRILKKNGIVVEKNLARSRKSREREDARLRSQYVEYSSPFSRTLMRSSLFDAIERMRMLGFVPRAVERREVLRKIRHVLKEGGLSAYGFSWREIPSV